MPGPPSAHVCRSLAAFVVALAAPTVAAPPASAQFAPGAPGLGDPFFPDAGNGGYEVSHYDLALDYTPRGNRLDATARISASATADLSSFDLDFRGPRVSSVTVDGVAAGFSRLGQELVIAPVAGIAAGSRFEVEVAYAGRPHPLRDLDGSEEGWVRTDDGAVALGEPQGSPTWFPSNDSLADKATYEIELTVPKGLEAISNGALVGRRSAAGRTSWRWRTREPMATYLAMVGIGQFRLDRSRQAGIASMIAVDPRLARRSERALAKLPRILRLYRRLFGPYPFGQVGALVADAPELGYALETQTRPTFTGAPSGVVLAHEISHQWFGDSVSIRTWPEVWLNEGFATWAEWRYEQAAGGPSTARRFRELLEVPAAQREYWDPPPGAIPDPASLFAGAVYSRGAMALEALRQRVGDEDFYATLRAWAAEHRHANATIAEFIALAEATSGEELGPLFDTWLRHPGKPDTG